MQRIKQIIKVNFLKSLKFFSVDSVTRLLPIPAVIDEKITVINPHIEFIMK